MTKHKISFTTWVLLAFSISVWVIALSDTDFRNLLEEAYVYASN